MDEGGGNSSPTSPPAVIEGVDMEEEEEEEDVRFCDCCSCWCCDGVLEDEEDPRRGMEDEDPWGSSPICSITSRAACIAI